MGESGLGADRGLRALLPYSTVALVVAMAYAGWTIWSRHSATQRVLEEQQSKEAQQAAKITHMYGDGNLKILAFYASPGAIAPGGQALLCYGVSNAASVAIEPHVADTKPAISNCLQVHPATNTEYKLTAKDAAGHQMQQSVTLRVAK